MFFSCSIVLAFAAVSLTACLPHSCFSSLLFTTSQFPTFSAFSLFVCSFPVFLIFNSERNLSWFFAMLMSNCQQRVPIRPLLCPLHHRVVLVGYIKLFSLDILVFVVFLVVMLNFLSLRFLLFWRLFPNISLEPHRRKHHLSQCHFANYV